jgi:hypothetical protein
LLLGSLFVLGYVYTLDGAVVDEDEDEDSDLRIERKVVSGGGGPFFRRSVVAAAVVVVRELSFLEMKLRGGGPLRGAVVDGVELSRIERARA